MSQNDRPILYTYFRSSCSARVRIALAWKGIEYESKFIHLLKDEQLSEEYKKVNPQAGIPSMIHNNNTLTQSLALLEYIEEVYPNNPLLPKSPVARAQVRAISQIIAVDIQPVQNLRVLRKVGEEGKQEWGKYWINLGFQGLEKQLSETSGKYCYGDEVTIADICLYPQVYNAERFNVDVASFPNIKRIYNELEKLDAFKKGDWKAQPDCPEDLRVPS